MLGNSTACKKACTCDGPPLSKTCLSKTYTQFNSVVFKSKMMFLLHEELLDSTWDQVFDLTNNYKTYVKKWISLRVKKFCLESGYLTHQIEARNKSVTDDVIETVQLTLEQAKDSPSAWFQLLLSKLTKNILR